MDVQSLRLKVFVDGAFDFDDDVLIRVFHQWIQNRTLTETLLIDVADYRHVHNGPGIMLIGHDIHLGLDSAEGRPGLVYAFKRDVAGPLEHKLDALVGGALNACRLLEKEPVFQGKLRFRTDEMQIGAMSRLLVPNTDDTFERFVPYVRKYWERLFPGAKLEVTRRAPSPAPFAISVHADESYSVGDLLGRLGPSFAAAV